MKRGASRQELNVSFFKEKQLQVEEFGNTLKNSFIQTFDRMIQKVSHAFSDSDGDSKSKEDGPSNDVSNAESDEADEIVRPRKRKRVEVDK